jgi:pimeloyl-ACP methyl ester carboxylesterase
MNDVVHRIPGMTVIEHRLEVPLDHGDPQGPRIEIFARELVACGKENEKRPCLLYLQGGPGFASPRPERAGGWIKRALQEFRVVLLDQRGVGRSTPLNHQSLALLPDPEAQAAYLRHFRADSIVRDAELLRRRLLGDEPWTVLGQSYGGFCLLTYLSLAPEGLAGALFAGGLPPLDRTPEEVYRATYRRLLARNREYYERYPEDAQRIRAIVEHLASREITLPGGGRLTPRRFQQLGLVLGFATGYERLHYLVEDAFIRSPRGRELAFPFLRAVENMQHFETNPLYVLLHESIYCQGRASRWAAWRTLREFPELEIAPDRPVFFTGEMNYPWMLEEYPRLRPLREAAELLAHHEAWPALYDRERLRANSVPAAAIIYAEDMYVEAQFSQETAAEVRGLRYWLTNEYQHDGIGRAGEKVLGRLLQMLRGEV